eukprot:g8990.t1
MAARVRVLSVLPRLSRGGGAAAAARLTPRFIAPGGRCGRDTTFGSTVCPSPHPLRTRAFSTSTSRSNGGGDDEETVPEARAEVETLARESSKDQWGNRGKLIYEGSMAHHVRGLKRVSITTCLLSILAVPAVVMFGKDSVPAAGQVAVMGTALAGAGGSTLLLNLCVSPYVFRMAEIFGGGAGSDDDDGGKPKKPRNKKNRYGMIKTSGRRFRAERMNIFGMQKTTEFSIDEVEPMPNTSRPFVSFKAGSNYYFIQGHDMDDKVLLKVLLGRELKDHEKLTLGKEAS